MQLLQAYFEGGGIGVLLGAVLSTVLIRLFFYRHMRHKAELVLSERKDQFIAITSHYLLTPISVIQIALTTLQEKQMTASLEERQRLYDALERGQRRLTIIAEQLALVGEIDQGELRLNVSVSNLPDTISSAIAALDAFAREKKITVRFVGQRSDLQQARFDSRRMKQAFLAVLDNAIKFSLESGTVLLKLDMENNIFVITVEDDGIGMPEGIVSHLSERFYRGTSLYNFDYEGFGLGLHIAQAIIRLHQGNISFVSKPHQGTMVKIEFPNL